MLLFLCNGILASGLTAGDVDSGAVDICGALGCKECDRGSNLGKLTGSSERSGAGLGVSCTKLIDGDSAGVCESGLVGKSTESGCLKDAGSDTYNSYILLTKLLCP